MSFTDEQVKALSAPLHTAHVKSRSQAGRTLSYVEAWHAIAEANRIFGFDGWTRETVELRQLGEPRVTKGNNGGDQYRVGYSARVRVTVWSGAREIVREGCGFGSGIDRDPDQAHESALKEAESDAMKRALMTFGNPFGLALYDKTQAQVTSARPAPPTTPGVMTGTQLMTALEASEEATAPSGRKSSAQAKRDGDDAKVKADIAKCDLEGLKDWRLNFDNYTASLPLSWLDSVHNMLELRLEELNGQANVADQVAELDDAFRASLGSERRGPVARNGAQHQGATA